MAGGRSRPGRRQAQSGRQAEARAQLQQALAFYRQVHAAGYLRQADALIAASA